MINVAVDTNVLVYAEEQSVGKKSADARALLDSLPPETTLIPVYVLGELYRVLVRKAGRSAS